MQYCIDLTRKQMYYIRETLNGNECRMNVWGRRNRKKGNDDNSGLTVLVSVFIFLVLELGYVLSY